MYLGMGDDILEPIAITSHKCPCPRPTAEVLPEAPPKGSRALTSGITCFPSVPRPQRIYILTSLRPSLLLFSSLCLLA